MRKFARAGNKVIFVNSISMGLPALAHKDLLPRIKRKLGSYSKLARQTEEGITVVSPASLPFFGSAAARTINRRALSAQIGRLARNRGLSKPILWIAIPTAAEMIGSLDESMVVYHVSDKYDANTMDHATDPALIRRLHEHAIDAADLVFYSGRKLFDEATRGFQTLSQELPRNAWIWAFLGASQYSQYAFEADDAYKDAAMQSFRKAKRLRTWKDGLPQKYFSKRIRRVFESAG